VSTFHVRHNTWCAPLPAQQRSLFGVLGRWREQSVGDQQVFEVSMGFRTARSHVRGLLHSDRSCFLAQIAHTLVDWVLAARIVVRRFIAGSYGNRADLWRFIEIQTTLRNPSLSTELTPALQQTRKGIWSSPSARSSIGCYGSSRAALPCRVHPRQSGPPMPRGL
jgi:hypothetical protein